MLDKEYASFDNKDSGKNIEPGQSVSFTFIATCDGNSTDIFEYTLFEMIEAPEELIDDEDWVEEYQADELARYVYETSDFETEEEYQEYLIRHEAIEKGVYVSLSETENVLVPTVTATPTPTVTPKAVIDVPDKTNAPIVLTKDQVNYTIINANGKAVQAFYKYGKYIYLSQRVDDKVVITRTIAIQAKELAEEDAKKWNITTNDQIIDLAREDNKQMVLDGFNHGQSMEIFKYSGKVYLMISAGDENNFGNSVAFVPFKTGTYIYGNAKKEAKLGAKILTQVGCANTKRKSNGTPKQVEVALSEDKSTMLVWCQMKTADTKRKVQFSCYNLKSVLKQFKPVEKKAKKYNAKHSKKKMRVTRQFSQLKKSTCYCSALQTDADKNIVKPHGSIQGLDLANKKSGEYMIYICGGNDKEGMQPAIACMSLSTEGKTKYIARTDVEPEASVFGTDQLEMEGMYYKAGKLYFVFAPCNETGVSKDRQLRFSIDSSRVQ